MKGGFSMIVMYITMVLKGCLWKFAESFDWQEYDSRLYHFSTVNMTHYSSMTHCFYVIEVSHMTNLSRSSLANENRIGKACRQLTIPNREYYWIESLSNTRQPPGQCKKMQKIGGTCFFTLDSCTSFAHPLCETLKISSTTSPHPLQANPLLGATVTSSRLNDECSDTTYVVPVERAMYYSEANRFCHNNYDSLQIEFGSADEAFISKYLQNCIGKLQEKLPYWAGLCKTIHLEVASIKKEKVDDCSMSDEKNRAFPICTLSKDLNSGSRTVVTNPTMPTKTAAVKTLTGAGNVNSQQSLYNRWFYITSLHQFYLSYHSSDFDSCISFCASMEGSRLAINPHLFLQNTLDKHDRYWANYNAESFLNIANRMCSLLISCPEESTGCSHERFIRFSVTCSTEAHCICERISSVATSPTTQDATASTSTYPTTPATVSTTQTTTTSTSTTQTTTTTSTTPTTTTTTTTPTTTTSTTPTTTTSTSTTPTTTTSSTSSTKTSTFTTHTTTTSTSTTQDATTTTSIVPTIPTATSTTPTTSTASTTPEITTSTATSMPKTITATSTAKITTTAIQPAGTREVTVRSAITNAKRTLKSSSTSSAGTEPITALKDATTVSAVVASTETTTVSAVVLSAEATTNTTPISHEILSEKHIIGQQEYIVCYREQTYSESRENCNRTFSGSLATFPGSLMYFKVMEQLNLKNGSFWIGVLNTNNDATTECLTFDKRDTGKTMTTTSCESKQFSVCSRAIYTHEDLQTQVLENAAFKEILKDMTVNRKDTILSKRKVSSAEDKRQSSRTLGAVSAFVLCSLVSVIVLIDLPRLRNLFIA